MTVGELIEALKRVDPGTCVLVYDGECDEYCSISGIKLAPIKGRFMAYVEDGVRYIGEYGERCNECLSCEPCTHSKAICFTRKELPNFEHQVPNRGDY